MEGLTSGSALQARWGASGETFPPDHPAWILEAHYLALACINFICTLSPQRIILGGGVMSQSHLYIMIQQRVQVLLNGYIQAPAILKQIDAYIVPRVWAVGQEFWVLSSLLNKLRASIHIKKHMAVASR